jgi:hypothetical protein
VGGTDIFSQGRPEHCRLLLRRLPNETQRTRVTIYFNPVPNAADPNATLGKFEIVLTMPDVIHDKA